MQSLIGHVSIALVFFIPAAEGALLLEKSHSTRGAINALLGFPPDDN